MGLCFWIFCSVWFMILLYLLSGSRWGQVTREESSMTCDTQCVDQVQNWNMTNFSRKPLLSNLTKVRLRINNSLAGLVVELKILTGERGCKCCLCLLLLLCNLWQLLIVERRQSREGVSRPGEAASRALGASVTCHMKGSGSLAHLWHNTVCGIFLKKLVTHFHITLKCLQLHHNIRHFE